MNARPKRPLGRNGYTYRQQFGVIVICANELQQAEIFNRLKRQGMTCKVVTV